MIRILFSILFSLPFVTNAQKVATVDEAELRSIFPACKNNDSLYLAYRQYLVNALESIEFEQTCREKEFMRQLSCNERVRSQFLSDMKTLQNAYNDIYNQSTDNLQNYRVELERQCRKSLDYWIGKTAREEKMELVISNKEVKYGKVLYDITNSVISNISRNASQNNEYEQQMQFMQSLMNQYNVKFPADLKLRPTDLCK